MTTFLLIGEHDPRAVVAEHASLADAVAMIAAYRRDPAALPRATDDEIDWVLETEHMIEYGDLEAVHVDRDGAPWFYVLQRGGAPGAEPKPSGGDADALWRAMAASR